METRADLLALGDEALARLVLDDLVPSVRGIGPVLARYLLLLLGLEQYVKPVYLAVAALTRPPWAAAADPWPQGRHGPIQTAVTAVAVEMRTTPARLDNALWLYESTGMASKPKPRPTPHPDHPVSWKGVAFRNGTLRLLGKGGRRIGAFSGYVVFTRNGISGPAALEPSRQTESSRRKGLAWLGYDFADRSEAELDSELRHEQMENPHLSARNWLQRWVPERVAESLWRTEGLGELRMKDLPKGIRSTLVRWVSAFPLGLPGAVPLEREEAAAGGVARSAVDPHSMRVKNWENLQVCGETPGH